MKKEKTYKTINLCIDEEYIELIDKVKKENFLNSRSKAVNFILKQYASSEDMNVKSIENNIRKMRYAMNSVDIGMQILLELMNGIYYREDYGAVPPLDNFPTEAYQKVAERIENKIAIAQYKKNKSLD